MSQSSQTNKNRYRVKSFSSNNEYSFVQKQQINDRLNENTPQKKIPLIMKNMNSVQKYIHGCKVNEMVQKQHINDKDQSRVCEQQLGNSHHIQKLIQKAKSQPHNDLKQLQEKCYIKYSSISDQDYSTKYQLLQNAQTQYVKLKHSIQIAGISQKSSFPKRVKHSRVQSMNTNYKNNSQPGMQFKTSFVNPKSIYLLNKKKKQQQNGAPQKINQNDIDKQLKTSIVQDGGKKYFADLYLMKRERDKMLKQIFGKTDKKTELINNQKNSSKQNFHPENSIQNSIQASIDKSINKALQKSTKIRNEQLNKLSDEDKGKKFPKLKINIEELPRKSYEQKMRAEEQKFIQDKILRDRSQKKQKMLKGRNMNWNVYYEMLALTKNEKDKIKEYCKFSQTYGED